MRDRPRIAKQFCSVPNRLWLSALAVPAPHCEAILRRSQLTSGALAAAALTLNAFVWGVSWWPFRVLQGHGLHPLWATAIIYVFALLCLLTLKPYAWRGLLQHPVLWWLVLASGLTNVGFNWAVTVGDVVRVVNSTSGPALSDAGSQDWNMSFAQWRSGSALG